MGSKGSNTTTTAQNQTYAPAGAGYIQNALNTAQNAAQLPFNIPQAPVAGFSGQQQQAFNEIGQAQGMAQPYYQQASNLFNQSAQGPDISQFFNPYASAVTAQMNNVFGQQASQNTGQLTQAAGGVGADRIAVGQSQLANQQGLAAGQTLSALYAPSLQAAQQQQNIEQGAAYGQSALGSAAQNAQLSGANALLGAGGLQQQLAQAQLNAPYQQQLAQAAFPYQQSQFLTGAVGALAPGLGGTTYGTGSTTTPAPSLLSQILGLGTAGVGAAGAAGAFSPTSASNPFGSSPSYGGGNIYSGDAYGGSASNPISGLTAADYGSARGGRINGYADGGSPSNPYSGISGVSDQPINIDTQSIIPTTQTHAIQAHQPTLNLTPQAASQSNSGSQTASEIANVAKMAMMFAKRGGRVDPKKFDGFNPYFADGGDVDDSVDISNPDEGPYGLGHVMADKRAEQDSKEVAAGTRFFDSGMRIPGRQKGRNDTYTEGLRKRRSYAAGGDADDNDPTPANFDERFPYRMPDPAATEAWRKDTDAPLAFAGNDDVTPMSLPAAVARGASQPAAAPDDGAALPANAMPTAGQGNPYATTSDSDAAPEKEGKFVDSPWAALMAAGLGIAGGTSPFAAVNIGQGGLQGLKALEAQKAAGQKDETIKQAAKRLEQEAKFHEDQFTRETVGQKNQREQADRPYSQLTEEQKQQAAQANRPYTDMTAYQQAQLDAQKERDDLAEKRFNRPYEELTMQEKATLEESKRQHDMSRIPPGFQPKADGTPGIEPIPGGPHSAEQVRAESDAKRLPAMADEDLRPMIDTYKAGNTQGVLTSISRGAQGPANVQRFWHLLAEDLVREGASGKDLAAAKANFMAQSAGARTAAVREAGIETAVNEAKGTFPEVLRTSANLPRSSWTPINAALEFYRTKSGSPEQRQFGAAVQSAITAYSQAMSRTGANSVYAQQHASELLSKTDGPEALKATIDQLNTEMAIAQHAPEQTRQNILNRILGIKEPEGGAAAPALPDAAKAQLKEGQVTTFGNGQKWTLRNGQPAQVQ